jgi:hypothetical protein
MLTNFEYLTFAIKKWSLVWKMKPRAVGQMETAARMGR